MHPTLTEFVRSGIIPPSSKARNLLLDLARNALQNNTPINIMQTLSLTNKTGKLKLSEAIQKFSVDKLIDEIDKVFGAKAAARGETFGGLTNCAQNAADTLEIEIHSPGGSVLDGYRISNSIKELRKRGVHVTATINTLAASMASVVAMAADKVQMAPNGRMMIHEVSQASGGTAADHAKAAKLCEDMSNEIAAIYAKKTGKPIKVMRDLMRAETWMGAEEAYKSGFIDAIVPINQTASLVAALPAGMTAAALATAIVNEQEKRQVAAKVKTLEEFRVLSPAQKTAFFKAGGRLVD